MSTLPNPERLRFASSTRPTTVSGETSPLRHKQHEKFLKGPIPLNWIEKAARQPGKALHIGIELWFWSGVKRCRRIALTMSRLSRLGVSRYSAYRALAALERVGLVSVIRHSGRKPVVTILDCPRSPTVASEPLE